MKDKSENSTEYILDDNIYLTTLNIDMRLIQVLIPKGDRADVLGALDEEGIDYAV